MEMKLKDVSTIMNMYRKRRQNAGKECSMKMIQKLSIKLISALKLNSSINHNISIFKVPEYTPLIHLNDISLATCIRNVKDDLNLKNYKRIMYHIYERWLKGEDCSIIRFKSIKFNTYTMHFIRNTDHILLIEPSTQELNEKGLHYLENSEAIQDLINSDPTLSDIERKEYAEIIKEQQQETLSLNMKMEQKEQIISSAIASPDALPTLSPPGPSNISSHLKVEDDFVDQSNADSINTVDSSVPIYTDLENKTEGMDNFKISKRILHLISSDPTVSITEWKEYADIINKEVEEQSNSANYLQPKSKDNFSYVDKLDTIDLTETTPTKRKANESIHDDKETKMAKGSSVSEFNAEQTETANRIKNEIHDFERTIELNQAFQHLNSLSRFACQQRDSRICYLIDEIRKELNESQTKN